MLPYLLKRLLLAIPALWLIASLIFFLSRLLPGSFGTEAILQEDGGFYSSGSAASRQAAYRAYLRRTGQDLPLFYIGVHSKVEPDTLHLIYPEAERIALQKLVWQYGDWAKVSNFFKSLKQVELQLPPEHISKAQPFLETLLTTTDTATIKATVASLEGIASGTVAADATGRLSFYTRELIKSKADYTYLIPALRWNGTHNQYHYWLIQLVQGEMGVSYKDGRPVPTILKEAIGNTLLILLLSITLAFLIALEISILMVPHNRSRVRRLLIPGLFLLDSVPGFVVALLLLVLFASPAFLPLFPVFGLGYYQSPEQGWLLQLSQQMPYMVLPVICLVLVNLPYLTNQMYQALTNAANSDFARTAKAKGLSEKQMIRKHALRNALLPVITLLSDFIPALVAGAVIIETIFAIPGMGRLMINSVLARDYPVIIGIVLVVALFKVLSHLLSDLLYSIADPRIRHNTTS